MCIASDTHASQLASPNMSGVNRTHGQAATVTIHLADMTVVPLSMHLGMTC